uniref:LIM zinc-binding domain-containing protein n=1 Tax=Ascaris lumbricoides TaxID=6252 RepID=A0A0M3IBJ8_ASCLU
MAFFSFPKNTTRLARWTAIANPRFPNFQPRPIDAICEKHFRLVFCCCCCCFVLFYLYNLVVFVRFFFYRKQDLLCAKPGLMDGADPHRDESLGEEDDETDQPAVTDKKESASSAHGKVDMFGMNESLSATISAKDSMPKYPIYSTIRSNHNTYDRDALDFISEDEEIDAGEQNAKLCCLSEIPMMKRRAKRMEKQCDTLFLMLRTLLQSSAHGKVDMFAMNESLSATISAKDSMPKYPIYSTIRSNHNTYDRDALDFISEDEEIDAGEQNAKLCCLSEIPMMKRRAKRMEKQCDTLFLMLRTLLQSTHTDELLRRKQEEEILAAERINLTYPQITDFEARSTHTDELLRRKQEEEILAAERINLTYPQITDFEARQMNALRALAEAESAKAAQRIERKDSAIDLNSNRRKEQLPSTSRSDDELEVLVDGKIVEQHEGDVHKDEATSKDRRKLKVVKGQPVIRAHLLESSDLPGKVVVEDLGRCNLEEVSETPRIDEENAVILHPTQNRLLEKKEIRFYIARAILCLKTTEITKSRIRMLAPSWMQIADDADILAAIDELKSAGLLVLTGDAKANKQKCDVYERADWRKIADIQVDIFSSS